MKIAVIGASGKAGSLIALEAKRRRHDVTAIVRDKQKVAGKGYQVLEKDLFDLQADDLKGFDAVVDAFGTAFDTQSAKAHQTSLRHLTGILEKLPDVRLLVVGGAASLYTDITRRHTVLESIPAQWQAVPANMKAAFEALQTSAVNWTYFSPAQTFDPKGPRTGKYSRGADCVLRNSDRESYLSYADYAVAMVDEIEDGRAVRKRFTAVSEKTCDKDGYCGTESKAPAFQGISRYRPQLNYELAGRRFTLLADRGGDVEVHFLSRNMLEYTQSGTTRRAPYECAKGAELAYFVNFEFADQPPRVNISLILDLQTRLATIVTTCSDFNDRYHTMCDSDFDFAAIDMPGYALPKKRHGFTTDLVGKRIQWHYSPEFSIVHCYYHPSYVRATFTPEAYALLPVPSSGERRAWNENPYDEKAVYVKARDGLYIVAFSEQSMARRGAASSSLLFLMDTDRLHDVGRSFGYGGEPCRQENYLFGAYGEYMSVDGGDRIENDPPFYTI